MRALPAGIELRPARTDEGLRVDGLIRGELARYRDWAPDWVLQPVSPERIRRLRRDLQGNGLAGALHDRVIEEARRRG